MRGLISIIAFAMYIIVGWTLEFRAWQHGAPGSRRRVWLTRTPLADPTLFTPEGLRLRRLANRFYLLGGIALVLILLVVNTVGRGA